MSKLRIFFGVVLVGGATQYLTPTSYVDADAFGAPSVAAHAHVNPQGYADADAFGSPTVTQTGLVRTNRGSFLSADNFGTGVYTAAAFTPSANSVLVVIAAVVVNAGITDPSGDMTLTGGGLTWTPRLNVGHAASWACGVRVWTAPVGASPPSTALAFDCGPYNVWVYEAVAFDLTGYDTGSPTGATASNGNAGTDGPLSLTLSGAPASTSEVLAALF